LDSASKIDIEESRRLIGPKKGPALRIDLTAQFKAKRSCTDLCFTPRIVGRVDIEYSSSTSDFTSFTYVGGQLSLSLGHPQLSLPWLQSTLLVLFNRNKFHLSAYMNEQSHDPMSTRLGLWPNLTHSNHQANDFSGRILPGIPLPNLQTLAIDVVFGHDAHHK